MSDHFPVRRWAYRTAVAVAILAATERAAKAQTTSCTLPNGNNKTCTTTDMTISVTIPKATSLSLTNSVTFPNNDVRVADYTAGFKAAGSVSIVAKANAAASVTLTSSAAPATFSGYVWSTDATTFNSPASVLTIPAATSGTAPKTITFRTKLAWGTDTAGSYTETLTFTITAP
jgi:hypothetical protein